MSTRAERIQALAKAAKDYIAAEKKRIDAEVSSLQAILDARSAGSAIQQSSVAAVSAAAQDDLTAYLIA